MLATSFMLYAAVALVKSNILCLTGAVKWLAANPPPPEMGMNLPTKSLNELLPTIELAEQFIVWLDAAVAALGVMVAICFLIAVALAFRAAKLGYDDNGKLKVGPSKCFVCLGLLFLLLAIVVHAILAVLSFSMTQPEVQELLEQVTSPCVTMLPDMEKQLAEAQDMLDQAQADKDAAQLELNDFKEKYGEDSQEVKDSQKNLDSAQSQLDEVSGLFEVGGMYIQKGVDVCKCMMMLIQNIAAMLNPAFAAFAADFLSLFVAFSMCCWCYKAKPKA
jgi:hypothetical protein